MNNKLNAECCVRSLRTLCVAPSILVPQSNISTTSSASTITLGYNCVRWYHHAVVPLWHMYVMPQQQSHVPLISYDNNVDYYYFMTKCYVRTDFSCCPCGRCCSGKNVQLSTHKHKSRGSRSTAVVICHSYY